jgi:beta-alanine--pyruvate transaminase
VEAIQRQAATMDYAPAFQMSHPLAFELSNRIVELAPGKLDHVFFCNSGSEAVDSALKIALAWQRVRGEASRTRLIGRERGYHGVGFGGISVGGIPANRKMFGNMLSGVDHLPHTHNLEKNAYSKGQPEWGAHLADELERLVTLHDASTIAAVIVEPLAGSTGVLIPPKGYLQRLREITKKHGILLIFDEVITAFGRLGASFAADVYGVEPDMVTFAKGVTSGTVPMGGVLVSSDIYQAFMSGPPGAIELFHGYTYSAHPLACAAGVATLQLYKDEDLFARAARMSKKFEDAVHSLKDANHVVDIRNIGLVGGIELKGRDGAPGARGFETYIKCFERGVLVRNTADIIALAPALIVEDAHLDRMVSTLRDVLREIA